jgi:hypothetical protein
MLKLRSRARGGRPMQRLQLDFVRHRPSRQWAGRALLLVAAAVSVDMGLTYSSTQKSIAASQLRLAKLEPARKAPPAKVSQDEVALARDTVERLATPWSKLFGALESAASDQVALLGIEPDPRAGTVTISGDSKDYLAALTYVLNLSRADELSSVQLVRHEQKPNAVAFAISAAWAAAKP